ncbi:MAG: hypothetical protein KJ749_06590, partial [Planctomycetes bacterium]|nr:hypothetical protein [Planctomycetota bacterium]
MSRRRYPAGTVLSLALVLSCIGVVPVSASESTEALERAIALFSDGDYLAAQEMLLEVDRAELSAEQQVRRDDYVRRVRVAINMHEKALRDLEDAETAIAEREYDRAAGLLDEVLANEYATEDLRGAARAHARDIEERDEVVDATDVGEVDAPLSDLPPAEDEAPGVAVVTAPPAVAQADAERARVLSREAGDMVRAGRFAEAERLYEEALGLVPGYPPAVEGLADAQEHAENVSGARGVSLIERIRREDAINWQRTVAQYRDAERMVRSHVSAERFDEANQTLHRARQIVESGKQFADPVAAYDSLRQELEVLSDFVRTEERVYHERKVGETRREIEENRRQRIEEVKENRAKQVESLMEQAAQLRKDGELEAAIDVLRQIVVIDPKYAAARFMMDVLEDEAAYRQSREMRAALYRQTRAALADVEKAKVPQHEEVTYAPDWLEIIDREGRRKPGESRVDALLLSALDSRVPVDFRREPFGEVIERLAGGRRLNVIVNWHDLDRAGIDRNAPIDLDLPNEITLRKALTEVLEQAGEGAIELGFDVADGVIT